MPTNFPGSNDSFGVPSAPATTPLTSAGDSTRNMVNNHGDMGAAIMAMQAQATFVNHNHNGTTMNGAQLAQANTHQSPDTDTATTALHHTLGTGANQGAAGNHTHTPPVVWPVNSIFITATSGNPSTMGMPGTWTQIVGTFVVASGSTYTGTGGTSSHAHTPTFTTAGAHSHTTSSVDATGSHSHTNSGGGTSTFGHTHDSSDYNYSTLSYHWPGGTSGTSMLAQNHAHFTLTAGSSGSSTTHSHGTNSSGSVGDHAHTVPGMDTQGGHSHTSNVASSSHIPPYLAVYVWQRTA